MAPDPLAKHVQSQLRVIRIGAHLRPPGHAGQAVGGHQVELAQHLAIHVAQLAPVGEADAQPGPGADALGVVEEPEAPGQHGVCGQHERQTVVGRIGLERQQQELAASDRRSQAHTGQRRQLVGRGADQDGGRGVSTSHDAPRRSLGELLSNDRQVGELGHGRRGSIEGYGMLPRPCGRQPHTACASVRHKRRHTPEEHESSHRGIGRTSDTNVMTPSACGGRSAAAD